VIKILQGSAVTLTMLGGLTINLPVANFLQCVCAKNSENWLTVDKVIAKIIRLTFFWPTLYVTIARTLVICRACYILLCSCIYLLPWTVVTKMKVMSTA